ncbi:MAG TPA: DUF3373 family protein [Nitrospirae bacterium]|nr:hypothetical protein BMS3Abin06_01348 [bacterium BMS3Abin06]HDH12252.1 DUF3373 family protein [Nitrospirota bacterium]HDZ01128.1 DUF3373 family protein [Nitrospirota bacterium]
MKGFIVFLLLFALAFPAASYSATQGDLEQKLNDLNMQLEKIKKQLGDMKTQEMFQDRRVSVVEEKAGDMDSKWSWLTIGGEYRFRIDSLKGKVHDYMQYNSSASYPVSGITYFAAPTESYSVKNDSVMFNRFRLKLNAQATENITLKTRLSMYKVWGHGSMAPVQGSYFADRAMGAFDGTAGYVPQDNTLRVDYSFATWSNIAETPVWFSIGRRYSTQGVPTNIRQNTDKIGTAGVAGQLIDYAFDGLTLGYAPYIEALPGAYAKFCYGRGYDSGFESDAPGAGNTKDTDFIGIFIDPIYTDNLNVELQLIRASDIFNTLPDGGVSANLGDVDNFGAYVSGKLEDIGIGDLNLFVSAAMSKTRPNENLYEMDFFSVGGTTMKGGYGLLYDDSDPMTSGGQGNKSHSGKSIYTGARYDIKKTGTKIGVEYNYGSKYWITFAPAADDLWTSKLGTRGSVYEGYLIQELPETPVSKFGKAFVRVGYQYYKFNYTGSNNWIGEPKKIDDLNKTDPSLTQSLAPLESAQDIYLTFDVAF